MNLFRIAALTAMSALPVLAHGGVFSITFEKDWNGGNGDIVNYYNGGAAADGSTGGPNVGVSFVNVSGLSNSAADPGFPFYTNAPSPQGTAYAHDNAYLNVAGGAYNALSFFYSTPSAITGGIRAYSGANGTGLLLGTVDLLANDFGTTPDGLTAYNTWTRGLLSFSGTARSFDFSASSSAVLFDNLATVPEPGTVWMLLGGALALLGLGRGRRSVAPRGAGSSASAAMA